MSSQLKFTSVPLEANLTLDRAYEWHREHSTDVPAFTYQDEEKKQQFLSWGKLGEGIDNGVQLIQTHIPETLKENEATLEPIVVGVLSSADPLTYTTFLFAHLRLTHASGRPILPFLLSPRNSATAIAYLIKAKKVKYLWTNDDQMKTLANKAIVQLGEAEIPSILPFPSYSGIYTKCKAPLVWKDTFLPNVMDRPAVILHSSGSTAFPKPLVLTHTILMEWAAAIKYGDNNLNDEIMAVHNTSIFHAMGVFSSGWAVFSGYIRAVPSPYSSKRPTDPEQFLRAIQETHSTVILAVPSFIEAWAADSNKLEVLKKMKAIYWAGSPLSERTGRFLQREGVNVVIAYGATEFGAATAIAAKTPIEGYEWFHFASNISPEFLPEPDELDTFELVLKECKTHHLSAINTEVNGVPAYSTSDLVQRHKDDPTLFRIKGRKDDQVMLSTGEKTNPGPMEHIIVKSPHVKAALVFGKGRPFNGVLIEPTSYDEVDSLGLEKFRNLIWPEVDAANNDAPAHSRIFKEMILVASQSRPFSYTAKNTPRRGAIINEYVEEINAIYKAVKNSTETTVPTPTERMENGGLTIGEKRVI